MTAQRKLAAADDFHPFLQRLFALEARPEELLKFRAGAVPYWGLIRLLLLLRLVDRIRAEDSAGDLYLKGRSFSALTSLRYVVSSLWRSPMRHSDQEILMLCSGVNWNQENGKFFNTRADYFARELGDHRTLLIEGASELHYSWPRATGPVTFKGGLTVPAAIRAKFGSLGAQEKADLSAFMKLLESVIGNALTAQDYALMEQRLNRDILRSKAYYAISSRMLDRLQPRLILMENAHFGFDIEIIVAARERGITTAEYQHGAVNPTCPFHTFHPHLLAAGYASCLPDFFLSYGDFWNPFLATSARIVTVGNPHIASRRAAAARVELRRNSIYFLSSANSPGIYVEKMREMVAAGFSVVFRPHPIERPLLSQRYGNFFAEAGIALDLESDFYGQLCIHEVVLGDGRSTSMFEAFALASGRVYVMEMNEELTSALPNHKFLPVVRSIRELKARMEQPHDDMVTREELFASDWRDRLARFVSGVLSGNPQ
jgi:hypothetical protein